jgi:hypothetical protein
MADKPAAVGVELLVTPPPIIEYAETWVVTCGKTDAYVSEWSDSWTVTRLPRAQISLGRGGPIEGQPKPATFEQACEWARGYVRVAEVERLLREQLAEQLPQLRPDLDTHGQSG